MATYNDDEFESLEMNDCGEFADDGDDSPRSSLAIPPPPPKGKISELRLRQNPSPATLLDSGAVFVWGQGDAYEIPRDMPPPSDLSELHPQLKETVRPGRVA